jgi:cysteinyl-tRNA synthetase
MLEIYNTSSRKKEKFRAISKDRVSFYHCGPTVYWIQHIGNMRAMVLADLVSRSFDYLDYSVELVRNYTDVGHLTGDSDEGQDKMSQTATAAKESPQVVAAKYIDIFNKDIEALGIIDPQVKPKATEHIEDMISMVQTLLDKDYAYVTELAIYFDISKFEDYTKLSHQDLSKNISTAGKGEVADTNKKNPQDFALWFFKAGTHASALQSWPSPFDSPLVSDGEGFPGWHIECSAMSQKYLGDTIDIHMGGIEHVPVHHTNEIAQSEAATGKPFVKYWLHNEHLTVDGGKMSKSEGTAYSVADIIDKGYDPLVLRYFFCQAHYRSKQNFTWEALDAAGTALHNLRDRVLILSGDKTGSVDKVSQEKFTATIQDDFNIPQALAVLWDMLKSDLSEADKLATVLDFDRVLGFDLKNMKADDIPSEVKELAETRIQARKDKNWEESDKLREQISYLGYSIEDLGDSYRIKKD